MVRFFLLTGDFTNVSQVLNEFPESIETEYCTYRDPAKILTPYIEELQNLLELSAQKELEYRVITPDGQEVDTVTALASMMEQRILSAELEWINSVLCAPCNCRLCCIGPEGDMEQCFFEIPLGNGEVASFQVEQIDSEASKRCNAMDEEPFLLAGAPFYAQEAPLIIHWQKGWSLVLPQNSTCPNLEPDSGRCLIYEKRPFVCRRPQIFPYILELLESPQDDKPVYRIRRSLLAIMDCPYVQVLQDEIARYAAACELELVFSENKK